MKKLLVISLLAVTTSLSYAGSNCGKKCDKNATGEKTGLVESSVTVAGSDCGKKCDKKADLEKPGITGAATEFAGSGCGKKCGEKIGDAEKPGYTTQSIELAGGCPAACDADKTCDEESNFSATVYSAA